MVRFFLGVLFGVAATLLLVTQFRSSPDTAAVLASTPRPEARIIANSVVEPVRPQPQTIAPLVTPAVAAQVPTLPAPVKSAPTPPQTPSKGPAPQSTAEHRDMALGLSAPLPPSLAELHKLLESETRDPVWSVQSEQLIRQYLAQHLTSPEFDVAAVECRQTLCEIQIFGYVKDAPDKWSQVMAALNGQMASSRFAGNSLSVSEKNGRTILLSIFHGRKP